MHSNGARRNQGGHPQLVNHDAVEDAQGEQRHNAQAHVENPQSQHGKEV